jgi:hypothetical protein
MQDQPPLRAELFGMVGYVIWVGCTMWEPCAPLLHVCKTGGPAVPVSHAIGWMLKWQCDMLQVESVTPNGIQICRATGASCAC